MTTNIEKSSPKTRFVLVGGFLGAGKTTLIGELARHYTAAGKRVGIITNDQAADLVDTHNLRSQGFAVGEVAGACFCCSFDDLVATAESLAGSNAPDILLAEPVGSCTDLVATVIMPLQQIFGDRFELAPFGVLLKPSHGKRILAAGGSEKRSGFSPQAEYIFRKQLEEADFLMIGRHDQLTDAEIAELTESVSAAVGDVPVIPVSPKTGHGVSEVAAIIDSAAHSRRRLLEIDYDTYADGEAELGWVNLTATLQSTDPISLDSLAQKIVADISHDVVTNSVGQIAHLKTSVLAGDTQSIANVVSNDLIVDVGLAAGRDVAGSIQVIVNARVAVDPDVLETACRKSVNQNAAQFSADVSNITAHSLRPGRPEPTHRVIT